MVECCVGSSWNKSWNLERGVGSVSVECRLKIRNRRESQVRSQAQLEIGALDEIDEIGASVGAVSVAGSWRCG